MREFLSDRNIPFVERNIRHDPEAKAELQELIGRVVVPVVVFGEHRLVGYDPEGLEALVHTSADSAAAPPPRDSADAEQGTMAAQLHADPLATINDLVARIREELAFNAAKGGGGYRAGMHDGLQFAQDALVDILEQYSN